MTGGAYSQSQPIPTPLGGLYTRPQAPADEPFLVALFESVKGPELALLPEPVRTHLLRMQYDAMTAAYGSAFPRARFEIVLLDETPVGRLIHDRTPARLYIVFIGFLPAWRGCGLGAALMRALLQTAQADGIGCEATVAADNLPSLRLWSKLGFTQTQADAMNMAVRWRPDAGR